MGKKELDILSVYTIVRSNLTAYIKIMLIILVLSLVIVFSIPNYYRCRVILAPELSNNNFGSLGSLASSFGLNLTKEMANGDALGPVLYPDLINSLDFRTSLFSIKVKQKDSEKEISYYEYLLKYRNRPWWSSCTEWLSSELSALFNRNDDNVASFNPFALTEEQFKVTKVISESVKCDVDIKTFSITIDVVDQDSRVAALVADSVKEKLQIFITDYRTQKSRRDLEYIEQIHKESRERYDSLRHEYDKYSDSNMRLFLQKYKSKEEDLRYELQIQQSNYSMISSQLLAARAKVQEDTPAFTILQSASIPVKKEGPKRMLILIGVLIVSFICITVVLIFKESNILLCPNL